MKTFYVGPNLNGSESDDVVEARSRAAVEPIADLILSYFRADGFEALVGLSVLNAPDAEVYPPGLPRPPYPPMSPHQERFGRYVASRFRSEDQVRSALIGMGDCYSTTPEFVCIKSIISCRHVRYGYDGQAFLCLHAEDSNPKSPDPMIIRVDKRPDILIETDYLDGAATAEDW